MRSLRTLSFLTFLTLLLPACGGGGGSSEPSSPASSPVAIETQPSSISVESGSAASFSVVASGTISKLQWQTESSGVWSDIPNATGSSYSIPSVSTALDGAQYRVLVSGPLNSVSSSPVTLTVTAAIMPPAISVQPVSQSAIVGASVTFAVTADGTGLSYQWQASKDGIRWDDVAGSTGPVLSLNSVSLVDTGTQWRVRISNSASIIFSLPAALSVSAPNNAPSISRQPAAAAVVLPQEATFTVVATGTPDPQYQWQISTNGGLTFSDVPNATQASYSTGATTTSHDGRLFRVRVYNAAGQVFSSRVSLTVGTTAVAPTISTQPANDVARAPSAVTYSVIATGIPTPTYQWQLSIDQGASFTNISGATAPTYNTGPTLETDSGKRYRVVVSNVAGTVTSQVARLTVGSKGFDGGLADITMDGAGNLLVASSGTASPTDTANNFNGIYKISPSGTVSVLAGAKAVGFADGWGEAARFQDIYAVVAGKDGTLYVADTGNHAVRKVSPEGWVSTLAGGSKGYQDGTGSEAKFDSPWDLTLSNDGTLYVADTGNGAIRQVTPDGVVTTLVGGPHQFGHLESIVAARDGFLYFNLWNGNDIFRLSPSSGLLTTCVVGQGCGVDPSANGSAFSVGIRQLNQDLQGNLLVGQYFRKLSRMPVDTAQLSLIAGRESLTGPWDGQGASASFGGFGGITVAPDGNIYAVDGWSVSPANAPTRSVRMIRKITPDGSVTTLTLH